MNNSDFNYRYVLEKFLADHTREKPYYVDIKTIYTKFKPCDMLYRYLKMLWFEKHICLRLDDDNILGVWGYDSLFEMVDRSPHIYREVKD